MTALVQRTLDDVAWTPLEPDDSDARAVLAVLGDGHRHTREDLTRATLLPDRSIRAAIELCRRAGFPIASSSSNRGYVMTWDPKQLDALERDLTSRALSALQVRRAIRRARGRRVA